MESQSFTDVTWGQKRVQLRFGHLDHKQLHEPQGYDQPDGYEPEVVNVFEHFVEPGDLVVDAGASIGFHTCLLSKLVGDGGIVMAFEPHLMSYKYLVRNVHVFNKLNNVLCLRTALWKFDCEDLELWSVQDVGYSSMHRHANFKSVEKVEGRMLDTLLTNDHPRLIKIDCEGTEAEVLLGAEQIIRKGVDCIILELNYNLMQQTNRDDRVMREYMHSLGYDMFLINIADRHNGGFYPPFRVDPASTITLEGGHHINVIFSTVEKVNARWKTGAI